MFIMLWAGLYVMSHLLDLPGALLLNSLSSVLRLFLSIPASSTSLTAVPAQGYHKVLSH